MRSWDSDPADGRAVGTLAEQTERATTTPDEQDRIKCILKNVMSLQTPAREEELFAELELENAEWDIVLLNETWRAKKDEVWKTAGGHLFLGAGGTIGQRGVAIILHRRLASRFKAFHAISERLCAVDVDIEGARCRFICVYMPHGDYDDIFVDVVYNQLEALCEGKAGILRNLFIGGDWNAVAGDRQVGDVATVLGRFGIGTRNKRGQWMIDWATSQKMAIANTLFCKRWEFQWTHDNGTNKRQIDYWMCRVS
jgi:exonuclease III